MTTISNNRRAWLGGLVSVACGFALLAGPQASAQNASVGFDIRINHVGISVANLEESVDWYVDKLGFELVADQDEDRRLAIQAGLDEVTEAFARLAPQQEPAAEMPAD